MTEPLTYADAGVDIDKATSLVGVIKQIAKQTPRTGVLGDIGGFGGLFSLNLRDIERPVLVSSTDGVGTKLKVAFMMDKHDTVGIDLVAMCVNDILVQGAKPLFFLDYLAIGKLCNKTAAAIISGVAEGCRQANCALIGGETAEMPGMYQEGEYDLAGFSVGLVDNDKIIDGSGIRVGYKLIGIASSGLHSNGYSLARKVCFDRLKLKVDDHVEDLGMPIGEALITPTKIYANIVHGIIKDLPIHGLAHITGGGIPENIVRIIPGGCRVKIYRDSWEIPRIFGFIKKAGKIDEMEMMRTFNNGIGMIAVVPEKDVSDVLDRIKAMNEMAWVIGEIAEQKPGDEPVEFI